MNKDWKENILTMRVLKLSWQYLTAKTALTKNVPKILSVIVTVVPNIKGGSMGYT